VKTEEEKRRNLISMETWRLSKKGESKDFVSVKLGYCSGKEK
jgi:hypothetical protein